MLKAKVSCQICQQKKSTAPQSRRWLCHFWNRLATTETSSKVSKWPLKMVKSLISLLEGWSSYEDLVFKNAGACLGWMCLIYQIQVNFSKSGITFFILFLMKMLLTTWLSVAAYATSVVGGAEMSEERLEAAGLNRSDVHVDFMIGSLNGYWWYPWGWNPCTLFRNGD